ncbi:MAG TPA: type II secretion system F family protein [Candidatus Paceibacterota bacterium]|jgi:type II secretory pathway component PulF|nr:type II secretion system F family protein [Candidatus Paceibacterota bacterium]
MSGSEKILFMRRLSLFLHAGMPLMHALDLMKGESARQARVRMHASLIADILDGRKLSAALARFPRAFDLLALSLVRAGESSGSLPQQLENIALLLERRKEGCERMIRVALYPAVLSCMAIGLTFFLTLYVFPKMLPLFSGFHRQLPIATRILIALTAFLSEYGAASAAGLILLLVSALFSLRYRRIRRRFEQALLAVPIAGPIIRYRSTAFITHTLSTLLESGLGILPALGVLSSYTRAVLYTDALTAIEAHIREGRPIADAFSAQARLFPPVAAQLIRAGEYTGTLPEGLRHVSDICEHYLKERSARLETLAEPVLMIVLGFMIGFVALAIITPIYGITQSL